jgi:hypothetical protein
MKTRPASLHASRNWRELWHADPIPHSHPLRQRTSIQDGHRKQSKQPAFHWLNQMLNRDLEG